MARHRTPWYQGDTIPVGIGQGYWTATPMQIAKATSVLVKHGEVVAPHLLRATIDNGNLFETQQLSDIETYPPITGVPKRYWDLATEGMRLVNHGKKEPRDVLSITPNTSVLVNLGRLRYLA
ncbi:penicillin-binding transpeptidase domain-containing protein [Vibrio sinaloensis]|nr:penicillin-binding transpeptidase domain-containing protein [Vibrio sinaloensis]